MVTFDRSYYDATNWWRVVAPDGSVWWGICDEQEARDHVREGDRLQRLYERVDNNWFEEI